MQSYDVVIVGGGIMGITAALELQQRGQRVAVLDQGPIPHPLAASTDISKAVRAAYGMDEEYTILMEEARPGWLAWNEEFGETLYHEAGVTMVTMTPMRPGGYEYESFQLMRRRGHPIERLTSAAIRKRFPAWNADRYVDGFFSAHAGWVASGRVVELLAQKAQQQGIPLLCHQTVDQLLTQGERVTGVRTRSGAEVQAETVIVAAGAWTRVLVPELAGVMKAVGMPVFHFRPNEPSLFAPPRFVNFAADVARTGYYGFPLHPQQGVVKIGYHGAGPQLHPEHDERVVTDHDVRKVRAFLAETFPALATAKLVYTRRCLYCDTIDEHFWIDRHPARPGLVVAAGGSGHAFKYGPLFGSLIANVVEGVADRRLRKFRWRSAGEMKPQQEASRYHE